MRIPQSLIPPFASTIRDEEPLDVESIGSEEILLEDANVQSETSPLEIVSVKKATLECCDYRTHHPHGCLIYCDPPYALFDGRATQYGEAFETDAFWATMREWSKHNVVFISEYQSPPDFVCIASHPKACTLAGGHRQTQRIERLFTHVSTLPRLNLPGMLT